MSAIGWLPWSDASFARAQADGKPVLLSIAAAWCGHCAAMDRTSYADPRVVAVATARFVPVRVDPDRRPDIAVRYGLGGWPTTAFLTSEGDLIGGGTYVEPERLADTLARVGDAFAAGRHAGASRPGEPAGPRETALPVEELTTRVFATFDREHGGFGGAPKFPHAAPVRLAIASYRESGSGEARDIAIRSLDAMGWGPLYDERDGGFYRCAQDADWGHPSPEKLLDVNASLLALYVEAFEAFQLARHGERAEGILRYAQTWLADPVDGGWAASQQAEPASHARPAGGVAAAPAVDRTQFADWNALMVSAALRAGLVMGDASLSEFAIRSLERLALSCYRPGAGMAHFSDDLIQPGPAARDLVRGLLDDQVAMAAAHLDAFEATGDIVYRMMAEELVLYALRTMWDEEVGGFFDRAQDSARDIGLLRTRLKPFLGNCAAGRVLRRLARATDTDLFARRADEALAAVGPRAAAEGPLAAEYVLAMKPPPDR